MAPYHKGSALTMKIALFGRGNTGFLVKVIAENQGHTIVGVIHSENREKAPEILAKADVAIDFSVPHAAMDNLALAAKAKVNVVMGTTGWYEQLPKAKEIVKKSGIGFIYSPNFSIGVALFTEIVKEAAKLLQDYDVSGYEVHHNKKLDKPSGTALAIAKAIDDTRKSRKKTQFASVRVGSELGTHTVIFDSPNDTITLTHSVSNRGGFAEGALTAAEWLKKKKGFFTLQDMLK